MPEFITLTRLSTIRELEIHAMRMGPGKHLKGRTLMGGIVKPEEVRDLSIPFHSRLSLTGIELTV